MTNNTEFTWAPLIPLIGGFPLGTEQAFEKPPVAIYSFPGLGNDLHYINYQNNVKNLNLEYKVFEQDDYQFEKKINFIIGTPPCAGLSSLNTGKSDSVKGASGKQNDYMYNFLKVAIHKFTPDIIALENAPALATPKGRSVADKLYEIAKEYGYSTLLYKTSTHFHGIPQRRDRTFAIFFKGNKAKLFDYQKLDYKHFKEYLQEYQTLTEDTSQQVSKDLLEKDVYYNYLKAKHSDVRKLLTEAKIITCLQYCEKNNLMNDVLEWAESEGTEKDKKYIRHAVNKFSQGLGVWDGSVHIFDDKMNAVIGRNLADSLHPFEDRSLTVNEALYMMGFPIDFKLLDERKYNHVAQNVPVCTAKFISEQCLKYLNGELQDASSDYIKQDNWNNKIEDRSPVSLDESFE